MPITPYTTPIQFEYKPLNLAAFAVPLAQMQEKFDVTQALINESDVDLAHTSLGTDPIKAQELKEIYRQKRDELAKSLVETGNYTQAATKLKELNRLWQNDPEKKALEYNYAARQAYLKEQKERIDSGKKDAITRDQYYQDIARKDREYKSGQGTYWQHDPNLKEGQYNLYGTKARLADLEKELEDMSWKVASAVEGDKIAGALVELGVDPTLMDKKFMQTITEARTPEKVAKAVSGYLKTLPRFRDWALEKADFDYDELKATNPEGYLKKTDELTKNALSSINDQIAYIEKESKKKGQKELLESDEYKQLLAYKDEISKARQTGEYEEPLIKGLYDQEALNKMYDMTALGKVFAYKKIDTDYTFRDIPTQGNGRGGGAGSEDPLDFTGGFAETTYDPLNLDNLAKQRYNAISGITPHLKNVNDIGGGSIRTLTQGRKGTDFRNNMEKNHGLQRERQEKIFQIAATTIQKGGTAKDFHRALWNAGIKEGNSLDVATRAFNALKGNNGNTLNYMQEQLDASRDNFNKWSDAKSQEDVINKKVTELKEFNNYLGKLGQEDLQVSTDKMMKLLNINTNDPRKITAALEKKGIDVDILQQDNPEVGKSFTYYRMKVGDIAKLKGKTLKQLVESGDKIFSGDIIGGGIRSRNIDQEIKQEKQRLVNSNLQGEFMSTRYVGDTKVDKFLNAQFLTAEDFSSFQPATTNSWKGVKGFDDEGRLEQGTKLLLTDKQSVKIVKKGNKMLLEIPYEYTNDDNKKSVTSVLVDFKKAARPTQEKIIDHILYLNKDRRNTDNYAKQTYETVKAMQFDMMTNSSLNDRLVNITDVDKGDDPVILQTVDLNDIAPGVKLQITKEYVQGRPPQLFVRSVNKSGKTEYLTQNGKRFSTSDIDAAKVFAAQSLYGE
jgi:hypothetical protein